MNSTKKILLLAVLSTGAQSLHAQSIAAGTVSLGGSVGYNQYNGESSSRTSGNSIPNFNNSSETTSKQFYLLPAVSYFVADNLAVGLALGYANAKRTDNSVFSPARFYTQHSQTTTIMLRAGAFAQYYKMLTAQFGLTGRLGAGYQRQKEDRNGSTVDNATTYYFNSTITSAGYYADLTPGIVFFPVPKFGISASIGALSFNHYSLTNFSYNDNGGNTVSDGNKNDTSAFAATFGLDSFLLGGTYYFGR